MISALRMPEPYSVAVEKNARKAIQRLHLNTQHKIARTLVILASNPRPPAAINLAGPSGLYRVRLGDYRIIYSVDDGQLTVLVVKVGHRREVYR